MGAEVQTIRTGSSPTLNYDVVDTENRRKQARSIVKNWGMIHGQPVGFR